METTSRLKFLGNPPNTARSSGPNHSSRAGERGSDQCSIPNSQFSSGWKGPTHLSFPMTPENMHQICSMTEATLAPSIRMRIENWELNIDQIPAPSPPFECFHHKQRCATMT